MMLLLNPRGDATIVRTETAPLSAPVGVSLGERGALRPPGLFERAQRNLEVKQ